MEQFTPLSAQEKEAIINRTEDSELRSDIEQSMKDYDTYMKLLDLEDIKNNPNIFPRLHRLLQLTTKLWRERGLSDIEGQEYDRLAREVKASLEEIARNINILWNMIIGISIISTEKKEVLPDGGAIITLEGDELALCFNTKTTIPFSSLKYFSDCEIQLLVKNCQLDTVILALSGVDEMTQKAFLSHLAQRFAKSIQECIDPISPENKPYVKIAQRKILVTLFNLIRGGQVCIPNELINNSQ